MCPGLLPMLPPSCRNPRPPGLPLKIFFPPFYVSSANSDKECVGLAARDICWAYLDRFSGMAKSGRGGGGCPLPPPEVKTLEGSPPPLSGSRRRLPSWFSSCLLHVLWAMFSLETRQGGVGQGERGRAEKGGFLVQRNSSLATDPCPPFLASPRPSLGKLLLNLEDSFLPPHPPASPSPARSRPQPYEPQADTLWPRSHHPAETHCTLHLGRAKEATRDLGCSWLCPSKACLTTSQQTI